MTVIYNNNNIIKLVKVLCIYTNTHTHTHTHTDICISAHTNMYYTSM